MIIKSIQKVIKVGDSLAVTIPAKDARRFNLSSGDELAVSYEKPDKADSQKVEIVDLTQKLIKRHKQALKNLSQR